MCLYMSSTYVEEFFALVALLENSCKVLQCLKIWVENSIQWMNSIVDVVDDEWEHVKS